MGVTHAVSGIAVALAVIAFAPGFTTDLLGPMTAALVILITLVMAGAALLPDLDNSASSARSTMGIFGAALSSIFRGSSLALQTLIRTRKDDPTPDPHRGFWHTMPAAALMGLLVWLGTRIPGELQLPLVGTITWGGVFALAFATLMVHLALTTVAKKYIRPLRKIPVIGEAASLLLSLIVTVALFAFLPASDSYLWLALSVAVGMAVHDIGDAFTTAGSPILFPLTVFTRKRFWWKTRFTSMKAGGAVENYVMLPLFVLLAAGSVVKLIVDMV